MVLPVAQAGVQLDDVGVVELRQQGALPLELGEAARVALDQVGAQVLDGYRLAGRDIEAAIDHPQAALTDRVAKTVTL